MPLPAHAPQAILQTHLAWAPGFRRKTLRLRPQQRDPCLQATPCFSCSCSKKAKRRSLGAEDDLTMWSYIDITACLERCWVCMFGHQHSGETHPHHHTTTSQHIHNPAHVQTEKVRQTWTLLVMGCTWFDRGSDLGCRGVAPSAQNMTKMGIEPKSHTQTHCAERSWLLELSAAVGVLATPVSDATMACVRVVRSVASKCLSDLRVFERPNMMYTGLSRTYMKHQFVSLGGVQLM